MCMVGTLYTMFALVLMVALGDNCMTWGHMWNITTTLHVRKNYFGASWFAIASITMHLLFTNVRRVGL